MSAVDYCFDIPTAPFADKAVTRLRELLLQKASEVQLQSLAALLPGASARLAQFQKVIVGSEFAGRYLCERPEHLIDLLSGEELDQVFDVAHYRQALSSAMASVTDEKSFDAALRRFRNRTMTRIIWRDFNRLANTQQTTAELTALADSAVEATLNFHYAHLCTEIGTPTDAQGNRQPMLVVGMGKLGAGELNLSSDIDLIFAFPEKGDTQGGKKQLSNAEFFTRLGQRLIKSLDAKTADGFVFRVDMRLRPYGQSGALVSSFDSLEDYYQTQGREWERFAMIKARVIACNGPATYAQQLTDLLRNFTYRRYVDFSAIDALRNLKQMIQREVTRRGMQDNVKLGLGGIRELEFVAQAFQLIRGGKDKQLQDRRLLHVLPLLRQLNCLPAGVDLQLRDAYCFLRDCEHAIQGYQDRQTQQLPVDATGKAVLAWVMGYSEWDEFEKTLHHHRQIVHQHFQAVIAEPNHNNSAEDGAADWRLLWHKISDNLEATESREATADLLTSKGFDQGAKALQLLTDLQSAPPVAAMHAPGRERLDELMPLLLNQLVQTEAPTETLSRLIKFLVAVARRSAYLLLLIENPHALKRLVTLSLASPWIANRLAEHPALLDELLDPDTLYSTPTKTDLRADLQHSVLRVATDDLEGQMEALRYFRSANALQVAACEVTGKLPLMKVSDYLTELAEVILEYVLTLAWQQMITRHGYPDGVVSEEPGFIIVGYGKLGGIELAHGSDLDLVFIHNASTQGITTGDAEGNRSIDNQTFYMRLGQKIIHFLNTQTPSGQLYEVDMRLRPSGNSGLLVSSFSAFEKYQEEAAWTWEHQALCRARVVAGPADLAQQFDQLRQRILCRQRDPAKLRQDVTEMRQKMRHQLGSNKKQQQAGQFHLKQDAGGIVDIEFMVQYAVLAWAHAAPALVRYTDNIRILEGLSDSGLLDSQEVNQLIEAYKAFRSMGHRLALQQQPGMVDGNLFDAERQAVMRIWQRLFSSEN